MLLDSTRNLRNSPVDNERKCFHVGARGLALLTIALVCFTIPAIVPAKTLDHRWYLGGGVSFLTTPDDIRSNAAIMFTENFGDDGIPFSGDPGERICLPNPGNFFPTQDPFCDPRPDDLVGREASIKDNFKFDLTFGYQITQAFGLQINAGYFKGEVGPVDIFERKTFPNIRADGFAIGLVDRSRSSPTAAGDLTKIPLSLTGIVRFRNKKSFRPYLGAGIGVIFTDITVNDKLNEIGSRLSALKVRGFGTKNGRDLTPSIFSGTLERENGEIPFDLPITVEVDDAFEWHLTGGLEYFFNDRYSLALGARYVMTNQDLVIDINGIDQIDLVFWPPEMFHPDGSLRVFINLPIAPNPACGPDQTKFGCFSAAPNVRVNPEGFREDPLNPGRALQGVLCPARGDFDRNGQEDTCYRFGPKSPSGLELPTGLAIVQGGSIRLATFSVHIGFRIHF